MSPVENMAAFVAVNAVAAAAPLIYAKYFHKRGIKTKRG